MKKGRLKIKNDRHYRKKGGNARIYKICCSRCKKQICFYQKDGPGGLLRLYFDRINGYTGGFDKMQCLNCESIIGLHMIRKGSRRQAFRLIRGSFIKKTLE